jgi:hypothetical protein
MLIRPKSEPALTSPVRDTSTGDSTLADPTLTICISPPKVRRVKGPVILSPDSVSPGNGASPPTSDRVLPALSRRLPVTVIAAGFALTNPKAVGSTVRPLAGNGESVAKNFTGVVLLSTMTSGKRK